MGFLDRLLDAGGNRGGRGGGSRGHRLSGQLVRPLLADDPHRLGQIGVAQPDPLQRALPQGSHAERPCRGDDRLGERARLDQMRHGVVDRQDLQHAGAALVPGAPAGLAAHGFHQLDLASLGRPSLLGQVFERDRHRTGGAELAHQPLGDDAPQHCGELEAVHAEVAHADDRGGSVVGVQSREDQVAGEARLDRDVGGFDVADLTDQQNVGVLPQHRAQRGREGEALRLVDLQLGNPRHVVLDRVFHGDDVDPPGAQLVERGVQRGGLAAAGRAGDQHHALPVSQEAAEELLFVLGQFEVGDVGAEVRLVQHADHDFFAAPRHGHGRDTQIDRLAVHAHRRAAVVRVQGIAHVEPGENLHAPDQRRPRVGGQPHDFLEHPVDPVAHRGPVNQRLGVDVAGALAHAVGDHRVDQLGHRRVERGIAAGAGLRLVDRFQRAGRVQPIEQLVDALLGAVGLVDLALDRAGRGDLEVNPPARDEPQRGFELEVAGVGRRERNGPVVGGEGNHAMLPGDGFGQQSGGAEIRALEIRRLDLEPVRQGLHDRGVVGIAKLDGAVPHGIPFAPVRVFADLVRLGGDQDARVLKGLSEPKVGGLLPAGT